MTPLTDEDLIIWAKSPTTCDLMIEADTADYRLMRGMLIQTSWPYGQGDEVDKHFVYAFQGLTWNERLEIYCPQLSYL